MSSHEAEVQSGERFEFGANWGRFLRILNDARISRAETSLRDMLQAQDLSGRRFLDVGSGSGLFSLAAHKLGAVVHSFDYDPRSVACTHELRRRYARSEPSWRIETGSVLDEDYLHSLGEFDIVYSWGVLHHTGDQWRALANVASLVAPGGLLFIALYNDQGWLSKYWSAVKRAYRYRALRAPIIIFHAPYLLGMRFIVRAVTGKLSQGDRGMSLWYDMIDWLGGWPFEVSRPAAILELYRARDFEQRLVRTVGKRPGCNEFVLCRHRPS